MRIIIGGAGEVGTHLAKILSIENHDIVVIEPDEDKLRLIDSSLDVMAMVGSATSIELLEESGIKKADLFIAVANTEHANITAAILGKKLGAKITVARIDNDEFLKLSNIELFKSLGIDYLIYPEKIASREIIGLLLKTGTTEFIDFTGGMLSLFVLKLDENAPIINKTLQEVSRNEGALNYRAVAITRDGETIIPRGENIFKLHDTVYVVSNKVGLKDVLKYSGKEHYGIKNLMILGGSRIGKLTATKLENEYQIKLIEIDKAKSIQLADILENTLVINGDGRDIDLLKSEGLQNMDAFIAVTGNSETNILSCQLARKMGVKKTIAEVENIEYIDLAENMGIDTIINKKLITASRISRFTMSAQVSMIKCLTGTDAEALEFIAKPGSKITQGSLQDINFPKDALVGGIIRGKTSFIATGKSRVEANDRVVVFALPSAIRKIESFF
ncbi:MAG: Trk system potassium transporter TrkA [Bacteroidetes bacterium]|nr:Trk system potassium transporter TrkA [Bacteroidota bacterium]